MKKKIAELLAAAVILAHVAPFVYAVTIEGQTPAGTYKQVAVTSSGQLLSAPGANGSPTCTNLSFSRVQISSGVATLLVSSSPVTAQTVVFDEGPDDVYLSTQNASVAFAPPSAWARFQNGVTFSLDQPASVIAGYYGQAVGNSTYTVLSISKCGN